MASQATEKMPTSVTDSPWIYESRRENVQRNNYPEAESGKWMMFFDVSKIDDAWARATRLYRTGQLPHICAMKVSTAMPSEYPPHTKVLIFFTAGLLPMKIRCWRLAETWLKRWSTERAVSPTKLTFRQFRVLRVVDTQSSCHDSHS